MEEKRKKPDAATVVKAVNAAVLCLLGLGISAYLLLAPRPTQSGIENRELAKFPEFSWESYFNAEYTAGITEYFTDTGARARHITKHQLRTSARCSASRRRKASSASSRTTPSKTNGRPARFPTRWPTADE